MRNLTHIEICQVSGGGWEEKVATIGGTMLLFAAIGGVSLLVCSCTMSTPPTVGAYGTTMGAMGFIGLGVGSGLAVLSGV
ncbi:MAG: hypothetical protein ACHQJ6_07765 [Candidatus Berkiellales bacterium]